MDEAELPARSPRSDGPPLPRAWAERDPVAARRLALAREDVTALAEKHSMPVENLLTPDYLRRVLWTPPPSRKQKALDRRGRPRCSSASGARQWQVDLVGPVLVSAILTADAEAAEAAETSESPESDGDVGVLVARALAGRLGR